MKVSFKGIGDRLVTFINDGAENGQMVKVSAAGTVAPCAEGDRFEGAVCFADGGYAGVRLGGFITAAYTGTAPAIGRTELCADGLGGVKAGSGVSCLVVEVDSVKSTVTFLM